MYCEIPLLKRCCVCIPLRRGILTWAYLKLMLTSLIIYPLMLITMLGLIFACSWEPVAIVLCLIVDMAMNVVLVVAGHVHGPTKGFGFVALCVVLLSCVTNILPLILSYTREKSHELLKVYFYYAFVHVVVLLGINIYFFSLFYHYDRQILDSLPNMFITLAYIAMLLYINLLVRTEFRKIRDPTQLQFTNNEAESECKLTMPQAEDTCKDSEKSYIGSEDTANFRHENLASFVDQNNLDLTAKIYPALTIKM